MCAMARSPSAASAASFTNTATTTTYSATLDTVGTNPTINAEFETDAAKLRDAYVRQLKKEAETAAQAGQMGIVRAVGEKIETYSDLDLWIDSIALSSAENKPRVDAKSAGSCLLFSPVV